MPPIPPRHPLAIILAVSGWPAGDAIRPGLDNSGEEVGGENPVERTLVAEGRPQLFVSAWGEPVLPSRDDLRDRGVDASPPLLAADAAARRVEVRHVLALDPYHFHLRDAIVGEPLLSGPFAVPDGIHALARLFAAGPRAELAARLESLPWRNALKLGMSLRRFLERAGKTFARLADQPETEGRRMALGMLAARMAMARRDRFAAKGVRAALEAVWPADRTGGAGAEPAKRAAKLLRDLAAAFQRLHVDAAPLAVWRYADGGAWLARWCGLAARDRAEEALALVADYELVAATKLDPLALEFALLPEDDTHRSAASALSRGEPAAPRVAFDASPREPLRFDARETGLGWALRFIPPLLDRCEADAAAQREEMAEAGGRFARQGDLLAPGAGTDSGGLIVDPVAALADALRVSRAPGCSRSASEILAAARVWAWADAEPRRRATADGLAMALASLFDAA